MDFFDSSNFNYLNEYLNLNDKLENLFEVKYGKNKKYAKYIYNGYLTRDFINLQSEFSNFVLIDTKNQTMKLTNNKKELFDFLELSNLELKNLKSDINDLILYENYLYNLLNEHGDKYKPKISYFRKLYILNNVYFNDVEI